MATKKYKVKSVTGWPATDVLKVGDKITIDGKAVACKGAWTTLDTVHNEGHITGFFGSIPGTSYDFSITLYDEQPKMSGCILEPSPKPGDPKTGTWKADEEAGGGEG